MSFTMRIFNDTTKYGVCLLFFIGCQPSVISSQQSDLMVCGNLTSRGGTLMPYPLLKSPLISQPKSGKIVRN